MPPVVTTVAFDLRLPLDPIGEWATGTACLVRTFDDDARIDIVVVDTEDFFPSRGSIASVSGGCSPGSRCA
ncbi:hypothetical protein [Halovenus salina]|uniref:Uncharacterized protein n=1 Tax=Halovenus salina TaxID=1510225 RepID=A0ABD5W3J0_9EURY